MEGKKYGNSRELLPEMIKTVTSGGSFSLVVTGRSMTPTLHHLRDSVIISPLEKDPEKAQILLIEVVPGRCILHRVCRVKNGAVYTNGDALPSVEGPFPFSSVVGRVSYIIKNGKTVTPSVLNGRLMILLRPLRALYFRLRRRS